MKFFCLWVKTIGCLGGGWWVFWVVGVGGGWWGVVVFGVFFFCGGFLVVWFVFFDSKKNKKIKQNPPTQKKNVFGIREGELRGSLFGRKVGFRKTDEDKLCRDPVLITLTHLSLRRKVGPNKICRRKEAKKTIDLLSPHPGKWRDTTSHFNLSGGGEFPSTS